MYTVAPRITGNYSTNDSLNDLIDAIDSKIIHMAKNRMMSIQYDLSCYPDLDKFEDLVSYKKLLLNKLLGCNCLKDQRLITIVSRIKKLLR